MKILITEVSGLDIVAVVQSDTRPTVGKEYFLEDAETGTGAQNRMFHKLVRIYYDSGCHSYPEPLTFWKFREYIKRDCGIGFKHYIWAGDDGKLHFTEAPEGIPKEVREDEGRVLGRLHNWADYTLAQRRKTITRLINEMIQAGVQDPDFESILARQYD